MRVINFYADNLLNLRAVSITPTGRVTRITGKNGAGKSAVFNGLFYALAGKKNHAAEPIRRGQKKATVRLDLGDDAVELTVTLTITEKDAYLDVEAPNGPTLGSPQKVLSALIGQLTFDPHAFSRMSAKERLETLRGIVKLDVDVDALDRAAERDFQLRTEWNRKVASSKDRLAHARAALQPSMDITPVNIDALTEQMATASDHNAAIDAAMRDNDATDRALVRLQEERRDLLVKIEMLQAKVAETDAAIDTTESVIARREPLAEYRDVSVLRQQINDALTANALRDSERRQREAFKEAEKELQAASTMSENLTAAITSVTEQKQAAIARAKFPIEGLSFGDGDVRFNDVPFEQASTGQRLRIATAIGMALNPKLRMLFIRNAALLDTESREMIEQLAEEHDFYVWMEMTQESATVGIHIVDGSVAAIDGVPVDDGELAGAAV